MQGGDDQALGRRLGSVCVLGDDEDDDGEGKREGPRGAATLYDLGDDALVCIMSFLSPREVGECSRVSRRLRGLCRDEDKVWYPMCERRFGSFTNVGDWCGCGRVSFKIVYEVLSHFDNLVGFWRGVGIGYYGSLVAFEWHSFKLVGFRVMPARVGSYNVRKVPFIEIGWIGVSHKETPVCLLDPGWNQLVPGLLDDESIKIRVSGSPFPQPLQIPVSPAREAASTSQGRVSPFEGLGPDWTQEDPTPAGLIFVNLNFVGSEHVVLEEYQQDAFSGYPFSGRKSLVEAAALTSFGSSENLCPAEGSPGRHSPASSGGGADVGSFPYEMYHYLSTKVTSPGGERAARKQRRRDRDRALSQGRHLYESEHFIKIPHFCPTREQPLQGLWKALSPSTGLDFVSLSYDDRGGITCRHVGDPSGRTRSGSVCWTARVGHGVSAPLPDAEQQLLLELRERTLLSGLPREAWHEEVVEMLWATGGVEDGTRCRVWRYASGRFGFGHGRDGCVVDFRPMCVKDHALADVVELSS